MGVVKNEEIKGYRFGNEIVCTECATPEEIKELKEDEIITEDEIEKDAIKEIESCYEPEDFEQ